MSLIRVFEMPAEFPRDDCFAGGNPTTFQMVDWFRDDLGMMLGMMESESGRSEIAEFIRGKRYIKPDRAYLVLHEKHSFTINYSAP